MTTTRCVMVTEHHAYLRGDKSTTHANEEQHGKGLDHFHLVIQANSAAGLGASVHISRDHRDPQIELAPPWPRDVQYRQGVTYRHTSTEKTLFLKLQCNHKLLPFEVDGETHLKTLFQMNYFLLFALPSPSKKHPENLTAGQTFSFRILDMFLLVVKHLKAIELYK